MDMPKESMEIRPTVATKFCDRKMSDQDKEAGLVGNAKEYMTSFVHASFDEHKACFKATWHKMIQRFRVEKSAAMEGESTPSKN